MKDLLDLVQKYAAALENAGRCNGLLLCRVDHDGTLAAQAAEYVSAATAYHAQIMTAYDELTRTTVRAVPDERLPVCTWQQGVVEVRGVLPDRTRSVRVRYTPAQALAAGTALIACAALADNATGGTLTPILPTFPPPTSTPAGAGEHDHFAHRHHEGDLR